MLSPSLCSSVNLSDASFLLLNQNKSLLFKLVIHSGVAPCDGKAKSLQLRQTLEVYLSLPRSVYSFEQLLSITITGTKHSKEFWNCIQKSPARRAWYESGLYMPICAWIFRWWLCGFSPTAMLYKASIIKISLLLTVSVTLLWKNPLSWKAFSSMHEEGRCCGNCTARSVWLNQKYYGTN